VPNLQELQDGVLDASVTKKKSKSKLALLAPTLCWLIRRCTSALLAGWGSDSALLAGQRHKQRVATTDHLVVNLTKPMPMPHRR
jgi:hypothetical protein